MSQYQVIYSFYLNPSAYNSIAVYLVLNFLCSASMPSLFSASNHTAVVQLHMSKFAYMCNTKICIYIILNYAYI